LVYDLKDCREQHKIEDVGHLTWTTEVTLGLGNPLITIDHIDLQVHLMLDTVLAFAEI